MLLKISRQKYKKNNRGVSMLRNKCALPLPSSLFHVTCTNTVHNRCRQGVSMLRNECAPPLPCKKMFFLCNIHKCSTYQIKAGGQHAPKRTRAPLPPLQPLPSHLKAFRQIDVYNNFSRAF